MKRQVIAFIAMLGVCVILLIGNHVIKEQQAKAEEAERERRNTPVTFADPEFETVLREQSNLSDPNKSYGTSVESTITSQLDAQADSFAQNLSSAALEPLVVDGKINYERLEYLMNMQPEQVSDEDWAALNEVMEIASDTSGKDMSTLQRVIECCYVYRGRVPSTTPNAECGLDAYTLSPVAVELTNRYSQQTQNILNGAHPPIDLSNYNSSRGSSDTEYRGYYEHAMVSSLLMGCALNQPAIFIPVGVGSDQNVLDDTFKVSIQKSADAVKNADMNKQLKNILTEKKFNNFDYTISFNGTTDQSWNNVANSQTKSYMAVFQMMDTSSAAILGKPEASATIFKDAFVTHNCLERLFRNSTAGEQVANATASTIVGALPVAGAAASVAYTTLSTVLSLSKEAKEIEADAEAAIEGMNMVKYGTYAEARKINYTAVLSDNGNVTVVGEQKRSWEESN